MTRRRETRDAKPLPRDSAGRVLWEHIDGFVPWFREHAPNLTNNELREYLLKQWGASGRFSSSRLNRMRATHGCNQTPDARRRAYEKRETEVTTREEALPRFLRELGPRDSWFVHVKGDCLVAGDWHVPYHSQELVERLCDMAKAWRIPTLIINGDFLNEDAFSRWPSHRFNVDWKVEKDAARTLLNQLFETFEEIVYNLDNHDRRLLVAFEERFRGKFDEGDLIDLLTKGVRTKRLRPNVDYHYVLCNEAWRITCPKEYRRVKLSLPHRLSQVYHQHVISGGDHLFGLGVDDSCRYVIANGLCMVDPQITPYVQIRDTTYPRWLPGFYMIRNNRLRAFPDHPALTDWDEAILEGRLLMRSEDRAKKK